MRMQEDGLATPESDECNTFWSEDASRAVFGLRIGTQRAYRLVIEMAGDDAWEWTAWPVGEASLVQCGHADTRDEAMRQADVAILHMEAGR